MVKFISPNYLPKLTNMNSEPYRKLVSNCQREIKSNGLVILPDFIPLPIIKDICAELNNSTPKAWISNSAHNIYLRDPDDQLPKTNLRNLQFNTKVASVAFDQLEQNSQLRNIYMWNPLIQFVSNILNRNEFYRLDDPLGACSVNVFREGYNHAYHFDESEYSITICLQKAESGGIFQYTPPLRRDANDLALDKSSEYVLNDKQPLDLKFEPGTLSIFGGRSCLHRVTEVRGDMERLVAVLCFATKPNIKNSALVQKLFWGRSM